jgi:hypothetical protein
MNLLFLIVVVFAPAAICIVGIVGAYFHDRSEVELFDDRLLRVAELSLKHREIQHMLETVNRARRQRGAPERTLEQFSSPRSGRRARRRAS